MTRLLFVWTSAEFSTWDVARGYRNALHRTGRFEILDYKLAARMKYHAAALGSKGDDLNLLTRMASENIVVEAIKHNADLVLIISGMALHPDAIWYLRKVGIRTAVLFTESPYNDKEQRDFHDVYPDMTCFTTERVSAVNGWRYLPHAYDPEIHKPAKNGAHEWDLLLIGTLWKERIHLLERANWIGLAPKFIGTWVAPPLPQESTIGRFYDEGCVHNVEAPQYYAKARVCLNIFRAGDGAESLNPRMYEVAACKAFQLTDHRAEIDDVFGVNGSCAVGLFTPETLDERLRYWLWRPRERRDMVEHAYRMVQPHTFDARVQQLLGYLAL